jgi:hypothetical protein
MISKLKLKKILESSNKFPEQQDLLKAGFMFSERTNNWTITFQENKRIKFACMNLKTRPVLNKHQDLWNMRMKY